VITKVANRNSSASSYFSIEKISPIKKPDTVKNAT
jgi:hypothetical protein